MAQVKSACHIEEAKYCPNQHTIVFVFDQSRCYTEYDENAKNIMVKDGGPSRLRDTVWAGSDQKMGVARWTS